ncbi:hypothetical protein BDW68DRAFT_163401 [Aspergillus falconensis]
MRGVLPITRHIKLTQLNCPPSAGPGPGGQRTFCAIVSCIIANIRLQLASWAYQYGPTSKADSHPEAAVVPLPRYLSQSTLCYLAVRSGHWEVGSCPSKPKPYGVRGSRKMSVRALQSVVWELPIAREVLSIGSIWNKNELASNHINSEPDDTQSFKPSALSGRRTQETYWSGTLDEDGDSTCLTACKFPELATSLIPHLVIFDLPTSKLQFRRNSTIPALPYPMSSCHAIRRDRSTYHKIPIIKEPKTRAQTASVSTWPAIFVTGNTKVNLSMAHHSVLLLDGSIFILHCSERS